ncbi:MAG: nucleotide sugar dehydrogenase [Candidatus Bathyarchaeia archaeon]
MTNVMNINHEDIDDSEKCGKYTISIIECNKTGFLHAYLFAEAGFKVIGVSTNPHMLRLLKRGRISFFRKTNYMLEKYVKNEKFSASSDVRKATSESDIIIVATSATIDRRKKPDYSSLERTCKEIGMGLKKDSLVLFVSSTGPGIVEGSMQGILEKASGLKAGVDFLVASSPFQTNSLEKIDEASKISRVVGAIDQKSLQAASLLLKRITNSDIVEVNSIKTVEAINLFQGVKKEIRQALANELAFLSEKLKIDYLKAVEATHRNGEFPLPHPGLVNSSARRGLYMLQEEAENVNLNLRLTHLARRINDQIAEHVLHLVKDALKTCGKTVKRSKVSVLGISRHPNVKDTPDALTKKIVNLLKRKVRTVQIYDPFFSLKELTELGFEADQLSKIIEKTDCLIILTAHSKFERLNLRKAKLLAKKSPAIVDISYVIDPLKAEKYGFVYRGLGRGIWTK